MKKNALTMVVSVFLFLNSYSQVSDSLFDIYCEYEDLVILQENMDVTFTGEKAEFINVDVKNTSVIIFKNEKGIKSYQPFVLPKRFDELYIFHAPAIRNTDWDYDDIQVRKFEAFLIQDGEKKQIEVNASIAQKRVIDRKGFFGATNLYKYAIDDINTYDTIEVSYHYRIAFRENWIRLLSNRIFLHGRYPKKTIRLNWRYNVNMEVDSLFANMDAPQVAIDGNEICYSWEYQNLPGLLDEAGSRPYEELPHMIFVPQPYEFEYTHFDSYKMEFIPIYFFLAKRRQDQIRVEMWDNVIGNMNKNNIYYQKVADKIIAKAPVDSTGIARMRYFQQFMVDSVRYDNAVKYYMAEEQHIRQRPGVELWGYTVSDNSLERIYGNMIPRLAKDLFTAYPVDKRTGSVSPIYCPTVHTNDLMYLAVFHNGTGGYVIPRSDKNHYYLDEMPFYYEDIPVMLLHIYDYANPRFIFPEDYDFTAAYYPFDVGSGRRNFNSKYRETRTPASNPKDNYRKVQSMVNIDLDKSTAAFQTRVYVSGQYSTLTRCVYCEKPIDSTINPKYLNPVWNVSENVEVEKIEPEHPEIYYPFKTTINLNYSANDIVFENDSAIEIRIGNWFKLVFHEDINGPRYLDYYPDFQGRDQYSYLIEFSKPVELVGSNNPVEVKNKYAQLLYSINQTEENKILVICKYGILARKIESEEFDFVKELNTAIVYLFDEKLLVRVRE